MKRIIIAALFLLVLGTVAQAQVCNSVTVGGADVSLPELGIDSPPNNDANLSIIAIERCDGTVQGQWHDTFAGGAAFHMDVTCVEVDGNDAWIGGVVKNGTPAPALGGFVGLPVIIRVRDNGTSANDPPDQAGLLTVNIPFVDCSEQPELLQPLMDPGPLYDLNNGQVRID